MSQKTSLSFHWIRVKRNIPDIVHNDSSGLSMGSNLLLKFGIMQGFHSHEKLFLDVSAHK